MALAAASGSTVSGGILTLDNVTLENSELVGESGAVLALDDTTTVLTATMVGDITNNGTILLYDGDQLTLSGTAISGGTITDGGDIFVGGGDKAAIDNSNITGGGFITVVNGGTTTNNGQLVATSGGVLAIENTPVDGVQFSIASGLGVVPPGGTEVVESGGTVVLENSDLFNSNVTVEPGIQLTVTGKTVTEGAGTLVLQGSFLESDGISGGGAVVATTSSTNSSESAIESTTITDGSVVAAGGATLVLDSVTVNDANLVGAASGTVNGTAVSGGILEVDNSTVEGGQIVGASGSTVTLDNVTVSGTTLVGNITVDSVTVNSTATLGGAAISGGGEIDLNTGAVLIAQAAVTTGATINLAIGSAFEVAKATSGSLSTNSHNGQVEVGNVNITGPALVDVQQGGTLVVNGTITGSGLIPTVSIENGGTMVANGTVDSGVSVIFNGGTGTLVMNNPFGFFAPITMQAANFKPSKSSPADFIVFPNTTIPANSNGKNVILTSNPVLNLSNGSNTNTINLNIGSGNDLLVVQVQVTNKQTGQPETDAVATAVTASAAKGPAGVAGSPINLALTEPSSLNGQPISVAVSGLPAGWSLNEGKSLGNGTWAVQAQDLSGLTVTTPSAFTGAAVLHVTETWTNPDGSTGTKSIADNVEAYGPGNPIFALAHNDTLTGTGANNTFVFAPPIGNDTINNFNAASDKIDLNGFAGVDSFGDLHIANDANGNAVVTLGSGETITLNGVSASALSASDFVFNQTPVTNNSGTMTIGDHAVLPLGGTIDNTGTIALDSTGHKAELQISGDGITLQGGGEVTLSGHALIAGAGSTTTLTNVDNTISGAGQIGAAGGTIATNVGGTTITVSGGATTQGTLTLINEAHGTIEANVDGATLAVDTGTPIVNNGVLEATNGGTLQVEDAVTGSGSAVVAGGTVEFDSSSSANVTFNNSSGYGELVLGDAAGFSGQISGFAGTAPNAGSSDVIDVSGINYNSGDFSETYNPSTGVLTLSDGTNTTSLTFIDFTGSFQFASDGNGGTEIFDPPATGSPNTPVSVGGPGHDAFIFQRDLGADTSGNFKPQHDIAEFNAFAHAGVAAAATGVVRHRRSPQLRGDRTGAA